MHSHSTVLPALLRWFGGFAESFTMLNTVNGFGVLDTVYGFAGVTQCVSVAAPFDAAEG